MSMWQARSKSTQKVEKIASSRIFALVMACVADALPARFSAALEFGVTATTMTVAPEFPRIDTPLTRKASGTLSCRWLSSLSVRVT